MCRHHSSGSLTHEKYIFIEKAKRCRQVIQLFQCHVSNGTQNDTARLPLSTAADREWQIRQHIASGTLTYHTYHSLNRSKDLEKLSEFDLVITT